jgi:hypothetical protein
MTETRPPYLFDPEIVDDRVSALPLTARLIHEKKRTGQPSAAFPKLQKSAREILRVLGRAHAYEHLQELLQTLERCLGSGWDAHQLGARDRDEFASLMSDLQVAEHCLIRGFVLESPVGVDIQGPKPDLYVSKDSARAIIEVFRPRELPAFHNFLTDVSRLVKEVDIPFDYGVEIKLDVIDQFDKSGRLVSPWHPIELNEALAPVADEALSRIASKLASVGPATHEHILEQWPDRNLKVELQITDIRPSTGDEPDRWVSNGKNYGGYEPMGMFARLMPPIISKAKKRQAGDRRTEARILVCDVSDTVVAVHLDEEVRSKGFAEILERDLSSQLQQNYDLIALVQRRGWGNPLKLLFAVSDDAEYNELLGELFGSFQTV